MSVGSAVDSVAAVAGGMAPSFSDPPCLLLRLCVLLLLLLLLLQAPWPPVAVICPVKGCRQHSRDNWASQLSAHYGSHAV
jgi:hypothetical protein